MTDVDTSPAQAAESPATYNPFEPGFLDDPYPFYAALRDSDPVHQTPLGFWVLSRHADVHRFLRDPSLSVEESNAAASPLTTFAREVLGDEAADRGGYAMLNRDAPDHTRLRRLVSKVFTRRAVEALRPRVEAIVDDACDAAAERGGLDLIADLAFPLPFTIISDLLGMPDVDHEALRRHSGLLVRSLEPVFDVETLTAINDAGTAIRALVADAIAMKRADPADDLLSALIAAEDDGDVLSDAELLEQVVLLYVAGHETTVNLIGNGTLALLRNRDQLSRLVADAADPAFAHHAVDELLRYDSPVQMSRRITTAAVEVGGRTIEPGTFVVLLLGSANRDADRWGPTGDRLDLGRPDADEHLSFGGGIHHCLGAALARLEGEVAIGRLIDRFPNVELAGDPVGNGRINLRGYDSIPLAV